MKYLPILDLIVTTGQAQIVKEEIETLRSSLYKSKGLEVTLKKAVRQEFFQALKSIMEKEKISFKDTLQIKYLLENIQRTLSSSPVLQITIAFSPSQDLIEKLKIYLKKNFSQKIILEIKEDPKILGGAVILFKGRYRDYSVKKQIEEYFDKEREVIMKLLQ